MLWYSDTIDVDDHPTEQEGVATSHDSSESEDSSLDNTVKATLDSQLQYATTKNQQVFFNAYIQRTYFDKRESKFDGKFCKKWSEIGF